MGIRLSYTRIAIELKMSQCRRILLPANPLPQILAQPVFKINPFRRIALNNAHLRPLNSVLLELIHVAHTAVNGPIYQNCLYKAS